MPSPLAADRSPGDGPPMRDFRATVGNRPSSWLILVAAMTSGLAACGPAPAVKQSASEREPAARRTATPVPIRVDQWAHLPRSVAAATLSRQGTWAATGGRDQTVKIWDVATGFVRKTLQMDGTVRKLAYVREDQVLLVALDREGRSLVRALDPSTEEVLFELDVGEYSIDGLSFDASGRLLLVEGNGRPASAWDLETGKKVRQYRTETQPERVSCPIDTTVSLHQRNEPRELHCGTGARRVQRDNRWSDLVFTSSPSARHGKWALHGRGHAGAPYAELWDEEAGTLVHRFGEHENVSDIALSADGQTAFTASDARLDRSQAAAVSTWDVKTGKLMRALRVEEVYHPPARMTLSRDRRRVVFEPLTARYAEVGVVWDLHSGETWEANANWQKLPEYNDGRRRAITIDEGKRTGIVWDTASQERLFELEGEKKWISHLSQDDTGHFLLATSSDDKTARVFRMEDGKLLHVLSGHTAEISRGALSPNGARAATASVDGTVRLWDVETGSLLHSFPHENRPFQVGFSKDGRRLLAGGFDGKLWDLESKQLIHSFSPDGTFAALKFAAEDSLVLGLSHGSAIVWDAKSGALLHRLPAVGHKFLTEVASEREGETVLLTAGRELTLHRLNAEREHVASVTLHRFESPTPRAHPPWLPPYERLTVTIPRGLFDGEPQMLSSLVYRFGDDPMRAKLLTGQQLAHDYQHVGLLEAFWKGAPLSRAPVASKDRPAPRSEQRSKAAPTIEKKRHVTAFLGHGAARLTDGSVGCLWDAERCGPTERYSRSLGVSVKANLPSLGFVTTTGRLVAPHLPAPLQLPIQHVSNGGCVSNQRGDIWCHDPKYPFVPGSPCPFADLVPVLGPSVGHQNDWCEVNQTETHRVQQLTGDLRGGCAVVDDGELLCWGASKTEGASGAATLVSLGAGKKAKSAATSGSHTCVLTEDGTVGCWGDATRGQLGYVGHGPGTPPPDDGFWEPDYASLTPERWLTFETPVAKIYAEPGMTCALLESGTLWCWGITDLLPPEEYGPDRYDDHIVNPNLSSTLPSAPVELPSGCTADDLDPVRGCVICAPSGVACLRPGDPKAPEGDPKASRRWEVLESL